MPGLIVAIPFIFAAYGQANDTVSLIHRVGCHIRVDDECLDNRSNGSRGNSIGGRGGDGGSANVTYTFNLGGPQGGNAGNGGSIKNANIESGGPSASPSQPKYNISPPLRLTLSKCRLTIAGKPAVDATKCMYEKVDKQFTLLAPSDNKKYVYEIKVALNEDKTGYAFLSGGTTTRIRNLGKMRANGPCWISMDDSVEICAWK